MGRVPAVVRRWVCAAHLVVIAVLSLLPIWLFPPSISEIQGIDKIVHFAMYGLLGALLRWAADGSQWGSRCWGLPMAGAAYGLLMEGCQFWFSGGGRSFSWGDAVANWMGVMLFWWWIGCRWRVVADTAPAELR